MTYEEIREQYIVSISDQYDGWGMENCEREEWRTPDGALHRTGDRPAVVIYDKQSGAVVGREYYERGRRHRLTGPAVIRDDWLSRTEYWVNGIQHRERGPAVREKVKDTGFVLEECYMINGRNVRADGPSLIIGDINSQVITDESWQHPEFGYHRLDGPAQIHRDAETGHIVHEVWMQNNVVHRAVEDGPAVIRRDETSGKITSQEFVEHGIAKNVMESSAPDLSQS